MRFVKRTLCFLAALCLLCPSAMAASKKKQAKSTPAPPVVPEEIIQEVPDVIQQVLDLDYTEWLTVDRQRQPNPNKYTNWRNKYKFGWCGGFITWCMLQLDIPQKEKNLIQSGEVPGIVHVKEADVSKLSNGYTKMNRVTEIPQKGFLIVYGKKGGNGFWHVGLVYDAEKLPDGKYRLTTIEGNLNNTIRMFIHDYDPHAEKKSANLSYLPEEERTLEETASFSYGRQYKKYDLYVNQFLMPWLPSEYMSEGAAP